MSQNKYRISYRLKTRISKEGEAFEIQTRDLEQVTDTEDLNEVFTDIFMIHRYEGLLGLEILEVKPQGKVIDMSAPFFPSKLVSI